VESTWTARWPSALGAFASPAALLVIIALRGLLRLHLQTHAVNLLRLNSQALQQLLTWLLIAAEATEASPIGVLLAAVDAESHGAPSFVSVR